MVLLLKSTPLFFRLCRIRMPDSPLVSIVTIFLNEQRFLQEAIESVLAQTSNHWELLLIDDGSSDGSADIAREYARRYPRRIRHLAHEGHRNLGKSVSRNLGLREARGTHLTFLDADDVFRPEKIERQSAILSVEPVAMVYGPSTYWHQWNGTQDGARTDSTSRLGVDPDRLYSPPDLITQFLRDGGTVPCISGLTVRRSAALEVGGFDEQIDDLFEDQVFIAKICALFPVFVESGCWDLYRQHPASTSQQAIVSGLYHPMRPNESHRKYLIWLQRHLASAGTLTPDVRAAFAAASWPYRHPSLYVWSRRLNRMKKRTHQTVSRLRVRVGSPGAEGRR